MAVYPKLDWTRGGSRAVVLPAIALLWWFDPLRVRLRAALFGAVACFGGADARLSLAIPNDLYEEFDPNNFVSKFARSGVHQRARSLHPRLSRIRRCRDRAAGRRRSDSCTTAKRPPHIIMVFDEGSFDITAAPGIKVPPGYAGSLPLLRRQVAIACWSKAPAGRAGTPNTTC